MEHDSEGDNNNSWSAGVFRKMTAGTGYIYIYIYIYIHSHTHTHTHTHTHIYIYIYIYIYIIERNWHFLSTYFFLNPFELPY